MQIIIPINPVYKKIVNNGDTIKLDITPIGATSPNK